MNKQFQNILTLIQSGSHNQALKKCKSILRKKPRDVNILLLTASIHALNNEFTTVIDYCKKVIQLQPDNTKALYNAGVAYLSINEYEQARDVLEKLTILDENHANAHSNLCMALWNLGAIEEAADHGEKGVILSPKSAVAHNNLGLAYLAQKKFHEAKTHFKLALSIDPTLASSQYNLGISKLDNEDISGIDNIEKALSIDPDYPEANHRKALYSLDNEETAKALHYFEVAIKNKPDFFEAYCNYGNALSKNQQFHIAEKAYRKAIELNPEYAAAYNNLGNALLDQEDYRKHFREAEKCYLKAIELEPRLYDTYKNLAVCYQSEGNIDKALHYFEIYNTHIPDNHVAIAGMASIHERSGNYEQGMQLITPLLNSTAIPEVLLSFGKLSEHFNKIPEAISALKSINDSEVNTRIISEKYFLLGKLSEKKKQNPEIIFRYYKKANDIDEEKHDIHKSKKMFMNIISYFTKDKIKTLNRSTVDTSLPIFIVGMPRSGTSLAEQILASHPGVFGAGELEDLHDLVQTIGNDLKPFDSYPDSMDNMDTTFANDLADTYLGTLRTLAPTSRRIVDKMPHNFMGLGVINIIFPQATVIHCRRSSIDTCLSIYFKHFNKHHSYANDLVKLGEYYNLYSDMMEHWKNVLDINIIELQYENVIEDPESEVKSLLQQCNLSWHPDCLKFYENKRTVMTPSYDQVRRPIYKSSVAKWKKYKKDIEPLINSLDSRAY